MHAVSFFLLQVPLLTIQVWDGKGGKGIWQIEILQYLSATSVNWGTSCWSRDQCVPIDVPLGDFLRALNHTYMRIHSRVADGRGHAFAICNTRSGVCDEENPWRGLPAQSDPAWHVDLRPLADIEGWEWTGDGYQRRRPA